VPSDSGGLELGAEVRHYLRAYVAHLQSAQSLVDIAGVLASMLVSVAGENPLVPIERVLGKVRRRVFGPPLAPELAHRAVALLPDRQLAQLLSAFHFAVKRLGIALAVEGSLPPRRVAATVAPADLPLDDGPDTGPEAMLAFESASKCLGVTLLREHPRARALFAPANTPIFGLANAHQGLPSLIARSSAAKLSGDLRETAARGA
jgi:hypothetical protein